MNLDDEKRTEINEMVKQEQKIAAAFQEPPQEKKQEVNQTKAKPAASELVETMHTEAMIGVVIKEEEVREKVIDQARKSIDTELKTIKQKGIAREQDATYNANEEACKNYGIDKSVETWKITMMKIGSAFWFIIYYIIASVTIAPISVFARGLKTFIKQTWLVIIISILTYLFITIGIPLIIRYSRELGLS